MLSNNSENIIPNVVNIAIKEEANRRPFNISSTSSLALLLFLILFNSSPLIQSAPLTIIKFAFEISFLVSILMEDRFLILIIFFTLLKSILVFFLNFFVSCNFSSLKQDVFILKIA